MLQLSLEVGAVDLGRALEFRLSVSFGIIVRPNH